MKTIPASEYLAAVAQPKRRKYGNKPVVVDGITFHSKSEAGRWCELLLEQRAGLIYDLERQVPIELHAHGGAIVGSYIADFRYRRPGVGVVIEDRKGGATAEDPLYRFKKRFVLAEYGIEILETGKGLKA
jgi:hypothetical protein